MYATTPQDLVKAIFGGGKPPDPDIPADFDPKDIRDTTESHKWGKDRLIWRLIHVILPAVFGAGLIGAVFGMEWLWHLASTTLFGMILIKTLVVIFGIGYVRANEAKGDFEKVAHKVFNAASPYWTYREFEKNFRTCVPYLTLVLVTLTGAVLLQWYLVFATALISFGLDAVLVEIENKKGKGLIQYKARWDEHQASLQAAQEERARATADLMSELEKADGPEPNALEAGGSFYRDPNDHSDVKYEGDDEDGDSHIRGS